MLFELRPFFMMKNSFFPFSSTTMPFNELFLIKKRERRKVLLIERGKAEGLLKFSRKNFDVAFLRISLTSSFWMEIWIFLLIYLFFFLFRQRLKLFPTLWRIFPPFGRSSEEKREKLRI